MKNLTLTNMDKLPYMVEEAMNRLMVNFRLCGDEFKTIVVTSSLPNEGKSFICAHLWRLLAEGRHKTLLIDADIRKSVLRGRYQINTDQEDGPAGDLPLYLSGQLPLEDVIYSTNILHGFMIPTFRTVANPTILLQSPRFPEMLDKLKDIVDYILVDTPPLNNVADGGQIASYCDGAVLVIRGGNTPKELVENSAKQLELSNCKLMGTVLNRVEQKQNGYYSKYYKYGYGYGYGEKKKKK